jgi:hypothetical protein
MSKSFLARVQVALAVPESETAQLRDEVRRTPSTRELQMPERHSERGSQTP